MTFASAAQRKAVFAALRRVAPKLGIAGATVGLGMAATSENKNARLVGRYGLATLGAAGVAGVAARRVVKLTPMYRQARTAFRAAVADTMHPGGALAAQQAFERWGKARGSFVATQRALGTARRWQGIGTLGAMYIPIIGAGHLAVRNAPAIHRKIKGTKVWRHHGHKRLR